MLKSKIFHYCFSFKKIINLSFIPYRTCYVYGLRLSNINSQCRKVRLDSNILYFTKAKLVSRFSNQTYSSGIQSLADYIIANSENSNLNLNERKDELIKVLNFLESKGVSTTDIKNKYMQYLNIANISYVKAKLLADIGTDVSMLLPLLSLSLPVLRIASNRARSYRSQIKGFPDRISYLCHHLELSSIDLILVLTKHSSLLTMPFARLDQKMHILKNAGISSKYIVKDLWIFNYNEKLLATRVQAAEKAGLQLKPWMLRCSKQFFESMLLKYSEKQRILNGEDEVSYLAKKLDCGNEYVEYMMERNKSMKTINISKLDQIITFLYEKGYTPQEVRLFPRVFCASFKTLNQRFEEFRRLRSTLPTMSQLCMSKKVVSSIKKEN